jgi:hypothetical protein
MVRFRQGILVFLQLVSLQKGFSVVVLDSVLISYVSSIGV